MKYIKNLQKKTVIIIASVIGVIVVAIVLFICLKSGKISEEQKLENSLKELGTNFYEEFYYKQVGTNDNEKTEFLSKYKDLGIKVSLDNLFRYQEEEDTELIKSFVNSETKEECDRVNSMVVIYPKEPYGVKDYKIDSILVCGYDKENNSDSNDNAASKENNNKE